MKKIWHHYEKWEEFQYGMWKKLPTEQEQEMVAKAISFTGDAAIYGAAMLRVTNEWPFSCEQHLTDASLNRRAWIGHAAACLAIGCPEYLTRQAWWKLTQQQQDEANEAAEYAITIWENKWANATSA